MGLHRLKERIMKQLRGGNVVALIIATNLWAADGTLVFYSGDVLERKTAILTPYLFNANNGSPADFDTRSDNKSPEPEGVRLVW
jgi:hypothetical protein